MNQLSASEPNWNEETAGAARFSSTLRVDVLAGVSSKHFLWVTNIFTYGLKVPRLTVSLIVGFVDVFPGVSSKHTSRFLWVTTGLHCLTGICNGQLVLRLAFSHFIVAG
jgi:hypothetical protein